MPGTQTAIKDFAFVDLSTIQVAELEAISKMDGMAAGTFISMWGDEVTFLPEELSTYIKNTQRVLNSTKDTNGTIVGLPIDQDAHDHAGGAGWIVGFELDEARGVIVFLVNWTEIGRELVSKNIRRFFSPSVDIVNKVILGGSLTNYPASRNEKGQILLRPIELSQSIKELDMPTILEQFFQEMFDKALGKQANPPAPSPAPAAPAVPAPQDPVDLSNVVNPSLASLSIDSSQVDQLDAQVQEIVKQRVNAEMRKSHVQKFVAELVGGTKTQPYGFAIKSKDLIAWMLSLTDAQAKFAEKLLSDMRSKAIDFAEHGFENNDGFISLPTLPEKILPLARQWMQTEGATIQGFFDANPELGGIDKYNVKEFAPKPKE